MPKYLIKAKYTQEGIAGVKRAGGSSRREAVVKTAESVGGKLESFYFAFGDTDAYVVCDLPDNAAAAGLAMTVGASGGAHVTTVPLLTVEEVDSAAKVTVDYRKPGD
jgi:uncharacterized protein with GYD domain